MKLTLTINEQTRFFKKECFSRNMYIKLSPMFLKNLEVTKFYIERSDSDSSLSPNEINIEFHLLGLIYCIHNVDKKDIASDINNNSQQDTLVFKYAQ